MTRPNRKSALRVLATAGGEGMLVGDMLDRFTDPPQRQRRNRLLNAALERMLASGKVERLGKERSTHYHGTPCWRWRITPAGQEFLFRPVKTKQQQLAEARKTKETTRVWLLSYFREQQVSKADRGEVADIMHGGGITLEEIGEFFGITRERARQLILEYQVRQEDWERLPPQWGPVMARLREQGYGPWNPDDEIRYGMKVLTGAGCPPMAAGFFFGLSNYQRARLLGNLASSVRE